MKSEIESPKPASAAASAPPATPAATTPKSRPAVAPNPIGLSAADLVADIEANPEDFTDVTLPEDKPAAVTDTKDKEAKAREDASPTAATAAIAELTADQTAWLELRAAAKTPEEAAEIDKQSPEFTDEQWALVEQSDDGSQKLAGGESAPELTAQLETLQAEAKKFQTEAETAAKRLQDVEQELARAKTQPVAVAPMHPLLLADATQLDAAEEAASQMKEWALKNWDGSEAVEASGQQPAQPKYTAEQVRAAYARADKQLTQIIPDARRYLSEHISHNVAAKTVYPELFNAQSKEHQAMNSLMTRLPGLRVQLPNISTVVGDAMVGEKIRGLLFTDKPGAEAQALASALLKADPALAKFMPQLALAAKGSTRPAFKLPAKPVVPLARPGSSATPGRMTRPGATRPNTAPSVEKFLKLKAANGGNELDALTESLRGVNVD